MAGYRKTILNGDVGEVWRNETDRPHYQLLVSWSNTCGACAQYDRAVSASSWPIPLHRRCNCRQVVVPVGAKAAPWVDFRREIAALDPKQQAACVGASCWRLLKQGVVQWSDVVTPFRVRDLREVVAIKGLDVDALVKAGVRKSTAETAYQSVHTPVHQLVAQQRAKLLSNLQGAGLSTDQVRAIVAQGVAARVVASGPSGPQKLKAAGQTQDQLVRSFVATWIGQKPAAPPERKPSAGAATPPAEPVREPSPTPVLLRVVGEVPEETVDEAKALIRSAVPAALLKHLSDKGVELCFVEKLRDVLGDAADAKPPGWPDGSTYDDLEGIYQSGEKRVVTAATHRNRKTGEFQPNRRLDGTLLHETAHAVDHQLGWISQTEDFKTAHAKDVESMSSETRARLAYFLLEKGRGQAETFAELFAQTRKRFTVSDIREAFPETTKWMREFTRKWNEQSASSTATKKEPR